MTNYPQVWTAEINLIGEWFIKGWISDREYSRLIKQMKTDYPCGCFSMSCANGKRISNHICSTHLGLTPKEGEFHPITARINNN